MEKLKIYISLPITGQEEKAREKADRIKAALSKQGHEAISPFDIYAGKDPDYEDYLCFDLRTMMDCDAVYFCLGWEESCGCNIEHSVVMTFKAFGKKNFKVIMNPNNN